MNRTEQKSMLSLLRHDFERETKHLETLLLAQETSGYQRIGSHAHDISVTGDSVEGRIIADAIQQIVDYKREQLKLMMRSNAERI